MTNIIKVQFFKGGIPAGKAYSYYTPEPVDVGDIVDIKTNHGTARAMVIQADVPETEIAAFRPAVKTIIGKSACRCEECSEFTAIGEGDHICGVDPHRWRSVTTPPPRITSGARAPISPVWRDKPCLARKHGVSCWMREMKPLDTLAAS